jgi:hypothetical protein
MLFVSATRLDGPSPTDAYDVFVDDRAELSALIVEARSDRGQRPGLRSEAVAVAREAVRQRAPVYEIVAALRGFAAAEPRTTIGVVLLRFSQADARVELLNAGMPTVIAALPDGHYSAHPALSPAIGQRFGEVHPYELCPLVWGSTFYFTSSGARPAKTNPVAARDVFDGVDLARRGAELAMLEPYELAAFLADLIGPRSSDASLCVVHSDPARRFRSSII